MDPTDAHEDAGAGAGAGAGEAAAAFGVETAVPDEHFGPTASSDERLQAMLGEDPFYIEQLEAILLAPPEEEGRAHFSVQVRFADLAHAAPQLASQLEHNARYVLGAALPEAIRLAMSRIVNSNPAEGMSIDAKQNISARCCEIFSLPPPLFAAPSSTLLSTSAASSAATVAATAASCWAGAVDMCRANVSSIRASDKGRFIQVTGTIIRMGTQHLVERFRWFRCSAKDCGFEFQLRVALEHDNTVLLPPRCPNRMPIGKTRPRAPAGGGGGGAGRSEGGGAGEVEGGASPGDDEEGGRGFAVGGAAGRGTGRGGRGAGRGGRGTGRGGRGGGGGGGGGVPKFCSSKAFHPLEDRDKVMSDYQEIKLQEPVSSLALGCIPRSMVVILEHDLVNQCKAGDDVTVTGQVVHRWLRMSKGQRAELEVILHANHVRVQYVGSGGQHGKVGLDIARADFRDFWRYFGGQARAPLRGRDAIVRSVCPQLHGMATVKMALLMVLMGASEMRSAPRSSRIKTRGDCHLLLVGDPGTGKSQLMRYACLLVPRSVHTTGVGTTSAGLTCSASRDGGEWVLEAGALVLADRGICCIDEFGAMKPEDRTAIHEAMEQQTISVAKAGIVTTLNTRCSIIAASNPKARRGSGAGGGGGGGAFNASSSWDVGAGAGSQSSSQYDADLSTLTGIGTPLLSRFDLVIVLEDRKDAVWDERVASFILAQACQASMATLLARQKRSKRENRRVAAAAAAAVGAAVGQAGGADGTPQAQAALREAAKLAATEAVAAREASDVVFLGGAAAEEARDRRPHSLYRSQLAAFARLHQSAVAPSYEEIGLEGGCRLADGRRIEDQLKAELLAPASAAVFNTGGAGAGAAGAAGANARPQYKLSGKDVRWGLPRLQAYIAHIKDSISASMTPGAEAIIKLYFLLMRAQDMRSAARTTTRFLESVVRLAKAHARLMFRRAALVQDAVVAIGLMESSAASTTLGMVDNVPIAQTEFAANPDEEYLRLEEAVLRRLLAFQRQQQQHGGGAGDALASMSLLQWQQLSRAQLEDEERRLQRGPGDGDDDYDFGAGEGAEGAAFEGDVDAEPAMQAAAWGEGGGEAEVEGEAPPWLQGFLEERRYDE